jgi:Flp pilus assembly protein TadD
MPGDSALPPDTASPGDTGGDESISADTSDLFLNAYMANEEGEKFENGGYTEKALEKYRYAASLLDQISHDNPNWQPIIVDYRKKKVAENITRLEQQTGETGPSTSPDNNAPTPPEGELPQKEEEPSAAEPTPIPPPPMPPGLTASSDARDQITELEDELRDSQEKLKTVESDKESLASRLTDALKQLDQSKISETELRGELKQAQDSYQNAVADHSQNAGSQKQYQDRIDQLQQALDNAEADRDAADEQNADYARRVTKAHEATAAIVQQRDAANKRADDLTQELADTSKTAAQLVEAQKEITALKTGDAASAQKADQVASQLADAQKQIAQITSDRDAARQQAADLNGKLAAAQTQITTVTTQRDQMAAERDQALAELGKARDAEKRVTELLAENTSLAQKLSDDEATIKNFKAGASDQEKDKEIADLRKQVSDAQTLVASAQQQRDSAQSSLNDLQQQYDSTTAELSELKANQAVGDNERKSLTDENDLLRGIVLRELKSQARRDEARRLAMGELSQLKIQSDTLLQQITYLGEPVVQLTDKEKALFKDPALDVENSDDDSSMNITISAPKQTEPAPVVDTVSQGSDATDPTSTASPPPAAPDASAAPVPAATPAEITGTTSAEPAAPSDTPMQLASRTLPGSPESALDTTGSSDFPNTPAESSEASSTPAGDTTDAVAGTPSVPPELVDDARDAKEAFERNDYREAERVYEGMLAKAPNNVYILSNLGVVYFRNEKWKLAEESLKKAIAVAPEDVFSWCTLGIVDYQEKRYDDAINSLTRALAINPKYAVAHNYLGITASQKGWQDASIKELETAIDLDPNYGDACFNLAVVYAMENPPNKDLARKYYQRAISLGAEPDQGLEQLLK